MSLPQQKDIQSFSRTADALTYGSLSEYRINKKIFESLMPEMARDYLHHHVTRFRTTRDYSLEPYLSSEVLHSENRQAGFRVLVFNDETCAMERVKRSIQAQKPSPGYVPDESTKTRIEALMMSIMQEYSGNIEHIRVEYTSKLARLAFVRNITGRKGREMFATVEYVLSASNDPVFRSPQRH